MSGKKPNKPPQLIKREDSYAFMISSTSDSIMGHAIVHYDTPKLRTNMIIKADATFTKINFSINYDSYFGDELYLETKCALMKAMLDYAITNDLGKVLEDVLLSNMKYYDANE